MARNYFNSLMDSRLLTVAVLLAFAFIAMFLPGSALAAGDATKSLPYEAGLETLYTSLTGPVPFMISLVGIVACGAMLIFGGEISGFMRTLVFIVLIVAVIVQATSVVSMLGGKWKGAALPGAYVSGTSQPIA